MHVLYIRLIKEERGGYHRRRREARTHPNSCISIIIDGADWQSYGIPFFCERTHSSQKLWTIPVYLVGVLVHGRLSSVYIVPGHFKQGTNVVIHILYDVLLDIMARGEKIPDTLYLQLDNTVKQNKSRFMIGFLAALVQAGVFKKVVLSFLPKGHTHEDIDQLFSRIAVAMKCRDARSIEELASIIRTCYTDAEGRRLRVMNVDAVSNFSDFIDSYLYLNRNIRGITKFRQFIIKMVGTDVVLRCRVDTVTEGIWRGIEDHTINTKVFKTLLPTGTFKLPSCQLREPPSATAVEKYEKSIQQVCSSYCSLCSCRTFVFVSRYKMGFAQCLTMLLQATLRA